MNTRAIVLSGAAILATVLLVVGSVLLLLRGWDMPVPTDRVAPRPEVRGSAPLLQSAPQPDLAAYRAAKEQELGTLRWVDRPHGIAQIPIGSAMEILAARGGAR